MKITNLNFKNAKIIIPDIFEDDRGFFMESFSSKKFREFAEIEADLVQDNHCMSKSKNTLRGLHFQLNPKAQSKLVRCSRGAILDVIVDLKKDSPTYKQWHAEKLSSDNRKQMWVPNGFGHGYLTLTDFAEVQYKVDEYYSPVYERALAWNDPSIGVDWGIDDPILSQKDLDAPQLADCEINLTEKINN